MQHVLVTGSTGFIGKRLCQALSAQGLTVHKFVRGHGIDLDNIEALTQACQGMDAVFHCAGYAHADAATDDADLHWQINYQGTVNVCIAAQRTGVKYLLFASSVKAGLPDHVNGEPDTPYGQAKRAAEDAVLALQDSIHVVNLRLAMVYGAGGRGNLQRMARLIQRGFFPPLPQTYNKRSLVHVDDVVRAFILCALTPEANGKTLIIASAHAPSGRDLYDALRDVLALKPIAWAVPYLILLLLARTADGLQRACGKALPFNSDVLAKLLNSEYYDANMTTQLTGWTAQTTLEDGLKEMLNGTSHHVI